LSQSGNFDLTAIIIPVLTLTTNGPTIVSPDGTGNIDILGGANITTAGTPNTVTVNLTGTTQFSLQLGNAAGSLTSLGVAANGELPIGSVGANPVLATLTGGIGVDITNAAGAITIDAPGVDQDQILYVGKHGNDANDGLTINKAFLTFTVALAAAAAFDVIWCFDDGLYTEDLTGVIDVDIYAPNATLIGVHTITTGNTWTFGKILALTATTGITMNTATEWASVNVGLFESEGTGICAVCLDGQFDINVDKVAIANGSFIGPTTDASVYVTFGDIVNQDGVGTVFSGISPCTIYANGSSIQESATGTCTVFSTTGAGISYISVTCSVVKATSLSNIIAASVVHLDAADMRGTLTETGAGNVIVGGATRIDGVPIGAVTASTGKFTTLQATALGLGVVQTDATGVFSSSDGTDGQLLIAATGAGAPVWADLISTDETIEITAGANTLDIEAGVGLITDTGFFLWDGAGPYFDDTVLGDFTVTQSGDGYINSSLVSWTAPQTVTGMTAGNSYIIYIDNTGTLQKTTTYSQAMFQNNIVLFECLRDSTAGTNNQVTVKENHPYNFQPSVSYWAHEAIGVIIENHNNGANITINGTQKIQINGADELSDHGLYTDIPDSAATAVVFNQYFTLASGKWARYLQSDTFDGAWDNAGAATALGANKYSVSRLYVSKDNLNAATPVYFSVLGDAQYNNKTAAQTAIANGAIPAISGELAFLELAQLGYIIFEESSTSIVQVIIAKQTSNSIIVIGGTNQASLVLTDTTNFDHILTIADTTVQQALETIDELTLQGDAGTCLAAAGTFTIAGGTGITTNAAVDTVTVTLDVPVLVTSGGTGIVSPTDHSILVGSGAVAMTELGVATNGQIPIGSTAADPVLANITGTGAITVTNGAGTIAIGGGGTTWSVITVNQTIVNYEGYVCNKAGVLALALPATAAVGTVFRVTGMNTDLGWSVTQAANQQIHVGDVSTTIGVGGSLASTLKRDSIECVCVVADLEWNCVDMIGNVTVT